MTALELQNHLYSFIQPELKEDTIKVEVNEKEREIKYQIYFIDKSFLNLYPKQRYHKLLHLIPDTFYHEHLEKTIWFELAPGEEPEDLNYHDDEIISDIKEPILSTLKNKVNFDSLLDNEFTSRGAVCKSDFALSKEILKKLGFSEEDQFDIFHVLMGEGGFCDCEILYNVFRESNYAQAYWADRT